MFRVYLDNCVFNRPFDDQAGERVRNETVAVLRILDEIRSGTLGLVWSFVNESENLENPFLANMWAISKWKDVAEIEITESPKLLGLAKELMDIGIGAGDALHLASAVEANADFFLTTDDKILRKLTDFEGVIVLDPIRMVAKIDEHAN
jgi:hypothetical protein